MGVEPISNNQNPIRDYLMQVKKEADLSEKQDQRLAAPQFSKSEQAKPIFDGPIRNQAAVTHDFSNLGYA